jgi:hypothetical protein
MPEKTHLRPGCLAVICNQPVAGFPLFGERTRPRRTPPLIGDGHTSPADFWNHLGQLLIWRTRLHHGRVSPLKNTPELSGITVEINNLRGNSSPPQITTKRAFDEFNYWVAAFQISQVFKEHAPARG